MAFYKWMQVVGGEEVWKVLLADQEERIIRECRPAFTTILAADNDFKTEMSAEDMSKVHYTGPVYFDFDASSIDDVIPEFQQFLKRLVDEHQFDLRQAALFASGGKGFHVTVPQACFIPKPSPRGYTNLPGIYREMAMEILVDSLDLRVYTARRGRQFRTANVERPDKPGVHKVPITVEEAFSITPASYRALCSAPRHVAPPSPPELNSGLALLFASAHDKVDKASKGKKKSKLDANLLRKFGGDFPPSILAIMNGEGIVEGVGFQRIAMQLALAAHSLGKTEEQFLALCEGLCQNHASDGTRYNTAPKRRQELSRMFRYMQNNVCYDFSVGGMKSLIKSDVATPDLDNGGVDLDEEAQSDDVDWSIAMGMKISSSGIWKKTEEGLVKVCNLGLSSPKVLLDPKTGGSVGYEVDIHLDGKPRGSKILEMDTFLSRQKFMQFTLATGGVSMSANDGQVGALADILRARAVKSGNEVYMTTKEGLDVINHDNGQRDIIWADTMGVQSSMGLAYKLVGAVTSDAEFRTDLRNASPLKDSAAAEEYFTRLFRINSAEVIAKIFGWHLACFVCQPIRHIYEQKFPMMQVFGPAGAGKTETNRLFSSMHYWRKPTRVFSVSRLTPFTLDALLASSASLPVILDELKPREMRKDRLENLKNCLRDNYGSAAGGRGRKDQSGGSSKYDVSSPTNSAPVISIGEALESQTALLDRAVMVNMVKETKRGHAVDFLYCQGRKDILAGFGRVCLDSAFKSDLEQIRDEVEANIKRVAAVVGPRAEDNDRPVFNIAVVLTGLAFGQQVMQTIFGDKFDAQFQKLADTLLDGKTEVIPRSMSEASKVLNTLVHLSQIQDEDERCRLQLGTDYIVIPELDKGGVVVGAVVEINVRNCYTKYARYQRSLGGEALYDNLEAFVAAMGTYSALRNKCPVDSPLKVNPTTLVYSFNTDILTDEGVGEFRS